MRATRLFACLGVLACAMRIDPAAQQAASAIVIRGVTLVDGTGRPPLANATVVVQADRIAQVTTQPVTPPVGARVIESWPKDRAVLDTHLAGAPDVVKIGQDLPVNR